MQTKGKRVISFKEREYQQQVERERGGEIGHRQARCEQEIKEGHKYMQNEKFPSKKEVDE